ncbi:MAG: hypothetical protein HY231_14195 [Acidobacteria bacterium]|nr:hypothetical protein [Acidobacteriota bacterium]
MQGKVLFVVGHVGATIGQSGMIENRGDRAIYERMGKLGFRVFVQDGLILTALYNEATSQKREEVMREILQGVEFIVLSSTLVDDNDLVVANQIGELFRDRLLPIIVLDQHLLWPIRMAAENSFVGIIGDATSIKIIKKESDRVGGLQGEQTVSAAQIRCAVPQLSREALKIATLDEAENLTFFYAYRSGAGMGSGKRAPARRIALLFNAEVVAQATEAGWQLLDAALELAAKAGTFQDVFHAEWPEIKERRRKQGMVEVHNELPPKNLVGLALSGGGLRSATFCLGLLQGLHESRLLKIFDYLSTVSGGGYLGGWWSAWLARPENQRQGIFPRDEKIEARRISDYLKSKDKLHEGSSFASHDPIHHLRLFSNYLTPRKGLLSGDTWQAITMIARNLVLTWVVLLPILFAFVVAGQFYFVLQRNSVDEFLSPFQAQILANERRAQALGQHLPTLLDERREDELARRRMRLDRIKRKEENHKWTTEKANQHRTEVTEQSEKKLAAVLEKLKETKERKAQKLSVKVEQLRKAYARVLRNRLILSAYLLVPLLGLLLITTVYWMRVGVTPHPVVKLAHTVPGLVFWLLVFCIFCLLSTYNFGDGRLLVQHFQSNVHDMAWGKLIAIALAWLLGTTFLWWYSLPIPLGQRWQKVWRESRSGNILNWVLIWAMIGVLTVFLVALRHQVNQGVDAKYFWLACAFILISIVIWFYSLPQHESKWEWRRLVHSNRLMSIQTDLMVCMLGIALVLALSGYGYEIANYLVRDPQSQKTFADYIAKAGGWVAFLSSIAGAIFLAVKSSPSGGEDKPASPNGGWKTRLVFAVTPVLVLISMAIAFAWLARWILILFHESPEHYIVKINKAILISVSMYLFLAVYEIRNWEKVWSVLWRVGVLSGVVALIYFFSTGFHLSNDVAIYSSSPWWKVYCLVFWANGIFVGLLLAQRLAGKYKTLGGAAIVVVLLYSIFFCALAFKDYFTNSTLFSVFGNPQPIEVSVIQSEALLAGILCCGIVLLFERRKWDGRTTRTIRIVGFTYLVLTGFLFFTFFVNFKYHNSITMGYLTLGLLFVALSWSAAIGWMTDPNLLSMHMFYKARLVRAYLGASNPNRKDQEISEAAGGDDVLLMDLRNCQRGAPYHLVNSTLNLVGGHDLATAQRHSDYFVFSKLYSGSSRTGYRRNLREQYMQGEMSLGTAVAISGAAVSPNMGAKTQTAAVAMLLTLLNVRLGYWASTPNRNLWRSAQAGLWPIYMLKEFLSQTNDLSGYCYLTDGGHFDNTGLYSLIERGCRFIILSDNGADTKPCFEDLGEAIRRCRIDFQTEIHLDIAPFFKQKDEASTDPLAKAHYIVGTITYSEKHLKQLGWSRAEARDPEKQRGILIVIKPSLVKEDTVDLRQYARQNEAFPQQSTGDLWYDEAQFESYRQIGRLCAKRVVEELGLATLLESSQTNPLTTQKIECAFHLAKKHYDEQMKIEEVTDEMLAARKEKFREQLTQCLQPAPPAAPPPAPRADGLWGLD